MKAVIGTLSRVATILLLKTSQGCFFMLPFASSFKIFINVVTFLYVKANLRHLVKRHCFLFFRKMLLSAPLLRFKPNYLEKIAWLPLFFFLASNSFCKDLFFPQSIRPGRRFSS